MFYFEFEIQKNQLIDYLVPGSWYTLVIKAATKRMAIIFKGLNSNLIFFLKVLQKQYKFKLNIFKNIWQDYNKQTNKSIKYSIIKIHIKAIINNNILLETMSTLIILYFLSIRIFIILVLAIMERLLSLFQEIIRHLVSGNNEEIERYLTNPTLPDRIKNLIQEIKKLTTTFERQNQKMLQTITDFNGFISIDNKPQIQKMLLDEEVSENLKAPLRAIFKMFRDKDDQIDKMLLDILFYRETIKSLNKNEEIQQDQINEHKEISEDKRKELIKLVQMVSTIKNQSVILQNDLDQKNQQELAMLKKIIAELKKELQGADKQKQELQAKLSKQIESLKKQSKMELKEKQTQIKQLTSKYDKLKTKSKKSNIFESENANLHSRIQILTTQIESIIKQKLNLQQIINQNETKIQQMNATNHSQVQEINNLNKEIEVLKINQESVIKLKTQLEEYRPPFSVSQSSSILQGQLAERFRQCEEYSRLLQKSMEQINSNYQRGGGGGSKIYYSGDEEINIPSQIQGNQVEAYLKSNYFSSSKSLAYLLQQFGQIQKLNRLYTYPLQKDINFHKKIESKRNIAIFCLTVNNSIIGAYTSEGFSSKSASKNIRSFIFSANQNKIKVLKLKNGKKSIQLDKDYLIFGCEELSFQYNRRHVSSYYDSNPELNNFQGSKQDRQQFLAIAGTNDNQSSTESLEIKSYEIFEVVFK